MEYIERHLDQRIEGAELAQIAATSEYHMRRLFSALAGMPLSEYIRRRRLTVAGAEVLAGGRTLLDIAVRYGYGSVEAFARAFRAMHGVGPGEAWRSGATVRLCASSVGCPQGSSLKGAQTCDTGLWRRTRSRWLGRSRACRSSMRGLTRPSSSLCGVSTLGHCSGWRNCPIRSRGE